MRVLRMRKADFLSAWSMKCKVFLSLVLSESGEDFGMNVSIRGGPVICGSAKGGMTGKKGSSEPPVTGM